MIRDKTKIYGEVNDPNNVIATGTLMNGAPVIGAGNKGIKTLNITAGPVLLYQDSNGNLKQLPLSANRLIRVKSDLTLELVNIPTEV